MYIYINVYIYIYTCIYIYIRTYRYIESSYNYILCQLLSTSVLTRGYPMKQRCSPSERFDPGSGLEILDRVFDSRKRDDHGSGFHLSQIQALYATFYGYEFLSISFYIQFKHFNQRHINLKNLHIRQIQQVQWHISPHHFGHW